ncbi:hypothetical protein [Achromobacter sp. UBA2119]|uniref:hypothetical protein n=1 Tax=Achromobacter sp. UBA2119 TaxID=1945911 RepID=UPI00257A63A6|nr:hypothetical protein [Achromobacter sp. UBA2119]
MAKSKKVAKKEGWMGILRADLALYRLPSEPAIDAEINEIKDLYRCYRGWKKFFRRVEFSTRGQRGKLTRIGKEIDT